MPDLIVSTITDNTNYTPTSDFNYNRQQAWASFSMIPFGPLGTYNISSVVDVATGEPWFYLTEYLSRTGAGSSKLGGGLWTNYNEYPLQDGSRIKATDYVAGFCGSSTTARGDWLLGYFSLSGN